ncbi:hypothetical protein [uncultured Chitinophaga sp.]|uniref:hypothetical protein n=1 Tax=uncultured Chitinophaga sp. TaxID=339340 RepID=UPI0025FAB17D|nr:hypothetical protein [uncultured Chitinophaga sp.]
MKSAPTYLKEPFFKALKGDISVHEFEQWLYEHPELEAHMDSEEYLELISFNYKTAHRVDFENKIYSLINLNEYNTYYIIYYLNEAMRQTARQYPSLLELYKLHIHGYHFLKDIAYGYAVPISDSQEEHRLTDNDVRRLIEDDYPGLESELLKVKRWLESGEIVVTEDGFSDFGRDDKVMVLPPICLWHGSSGTS